PDARISAVTQQFTQGQRRLMTVGGATTNDIGEYRIFGLQPGQYLVSASVPQPLMVVNGAPQVSEDRTGYAPSYFPSTANPSAAQKSAVALSQTVSEINIALLSTRLATITGVAVDSAGRPLTGGGVTAMARGNAG